MSHATLFKIPARRRDAIFGEIHRVINEVDAVDRSLEGIGEGMAVDEALEEIVSLLQGEMKRASRRRLAVA